MFGNKKEKPEDENLDIENEEAVSEEGLSELELRVQELEEAAALQNDQYARLAAEFDNYKKRTTREKSNLYTDIKAQVNKEWLALVDNLDRASVAIESLSEEDDKVKYKDAIGGVVQISKQAKNILESQGVEEIEALNQVFNPDLHEAVSIEESDDYDIDTVTEVLLKGYKINDKVIRHSIVKVSK